MFKKAIRTYHFWCGYQPTFDEWFLALTQFSNKMKGLLLIVTMISGVFMDDTRTQVEISTATTRQPTTPVANPLPFTFVCRLDKTIEIQPKPTSKGQSHHARGHAPKTVFNIIAGPKCSQATRRLFFNVTIIGTNCTQRRGMDDVLTISEQDGGADSVVGGSGSKFFEITCKAPNVNGSRINVTANSKLTAIVSGRVLPTLGYQLEMFIVTDESEIKRQRPTGVQNAFVGSDLFLMIRSRVKTVEYNLFPTMCRAFLTDLITHTGETLLNVSVVQPPCAINSNLQEKFHVSDMDGYSVSSAKLHAFEFRNHDDEPITFECHVTICPKTLNKQTNSVCYKLQRSNCHTISSKSRLRRDSSPPAFQEHVQIVKTSLKVKAQVNSAGGIYAGLTAWITLFSATQKYIISA